MAKIFLFMCALVSFSVFAETEEDCHNCGNDTVDISSAVNSMGNGQLAKIAQAIVKDSPNDSRGVRQLSSNSGILLGNVDSICGFWKTENWFEFEKYLKKKNFKLKDIYYDIKCSTFEQRGTSLFHHVALNPYSYKILHQRLMRQMQKEGGEKILTCSLTHLRFRSTTAINKVKATIKLMQDLIDLNPTETNENVKRQTSIKHLSKVERIWKKHIKKHPVQNPDQNCPTW